MNGDSPIPSHDSARLWFADGAWRFRCIDSGHEKKISALMRSVKYDVDALAFALGVGNRSFRRLVKDSLGISPGIWLRMHRAVAIRHQLREGAQIKQLSAHYGFKNQGDFTREFKKWHGTSPSRFIADAKQRE